MSTEIKIVRENSFIFKIIIKENDDNQNIEKIMQITGDLPPSIIVQFIRIGKERTEIYCIGTNHSDYISLDSRIGYDVVAI